MRGGRRDRVTLESPVRVLVVSNMVLLRSALVQVFGLRERFVVVGDLGCEEKVAAVAARSAVDLILFDVDVSCADCLPTVFMLREQLPLCRLVVLMDAGARAEVRRVVEAKVHGLVDRAVPVPRLVEAVERVSSGEVVVDLSLAVAAMSVVDSPLTPREAEVLRAAAVGLTALEIARKLALAPGTVRNYLSSAMTKTGTRRRNDAIRTATEAGWL
jgi:two-component system, NarL family, response regulator DesR